MVQAEGPLQVLKVEGLCQLRAAAIVPGTQLRGHRTNLSSCTRTSTARLGPPGPAAAAAAEGGRGAGGVRRGGSPRRRWRRGSLAEAVGRGLRWAWTLLARSLGGSWDPKMAAALRRLRALGRRRRRPLSLTERSGAGTRGAMAGGRRGAIARPEQSSGYSAGVPPPRPRSLPVASPWPSAVRLSSTSCSSHPAAAARRPARTGVRGADPDP